MAIRKTIYSKRSGQRHTEVIIETKSKFLGGRLEGIVHSRNVWLHGKAGRLRRIRLVEKELVKTKTGFPQIKELRGKIQGHLLGPRTPERQVEIMQDLKRFGCKTVPTFRLAKDRKGKETLLITDLHRFGEHVADFAGNPKENFMLCGVSNYAALKRTILENTRIANRNGYFLGPDAWLLVAREERGVLHLEPFIVDIGFSGPAKKYALATNMRFLEDYFANMEKLFADYQARK